MHHPAGTPPTSVCSSQGATARGATSRGAGQGDRSGNTAVATPSHHSTNSCSLDTPSSHRSPPGVTATSLPQVEDMFFYGPYWSNIDTIDNKKRAELMSYNFFKINKTKWKKQTHLSIKRWVVCGAQGGRTWPSWAWSTGCWPSPRGNTPASHSTSTPPPMARSAELEYSGVNKQKHTCVLCFIKMCSKCVLGLVWLRLVWEQTDSLHNLIGASNEPRLCFVATKLLLAN